MLGGIAFTNHGTRPCVLQGYVGVRLYAHSGQTLPVVVKYAERDLAGSTISGPPPAVALPPGVHDSASAGTQWFNWCGASLGIVVLRVTLPDGEPVTSQPGRDNGPLRTPRCDGGPGSTSTFYVTPVTSSGL